MTRSRTEYFREYRKKNRDRINEKQRLYRQTPEYAYKEQRQAARQRDIPWEFTYQTWLAVWIMSGKLNERGVSGYHMCRYNDTGPYSPANVYIAHHSVNRRDAYENGATWLAKQHAARMATGT